jgi:aspartate-semialdehyde dehydrogenase
LAEKITQMPVRSRIALVGGDSLLAKELRELLEAWRPTPRIELISAAAENSTVLGAEDDEAIVLSPLTSESLAGCSVAFLAGSTASSRRALKAKPQDGPALIDLTGALDDQPNTRLRAPLFEAGAASGVVTGSKAQIQVIAHPAAVAIATLLAAASKVGTLRRSIVHVFEPASERGKRGLDELQQQTVAVLSFKPLKTDVFDAQLGFNLLARYGEEALEPLDGIEQRAEKHLASLLSGHAERTSEPPIPMPSLRFVQAPVFHGHSLSLWIEFEDNPGPEKLAEVLSANGIDVHPDDPPSNVSIAGQSGISVGAISVDSNQPRACWLWAVSDNLKLAAENAAAVAKELLP